MDDKRLEALRIHWDAVVLGTSVGHDSIDSDLAYAINKLHALDRGPSEPAPDPTFAQRLGEQLKTQARQAVKPIGEPTPLSLNGHARITQKPVATGTWNVKLRTPVSLFSTLALVGLILGIAGLVWVTRDAADRNQSADSLGAVVPAAVTSPNASAAEVCTASPRDQTQLATLMGTPDTIEAAAGSGAIARVNIVGQADTETGTSVTQFIRSWLACGAAIVSRPTPQAAMLDRLNGYYSDDYFRRVAVGPADNRPYVSMDSSLFVAPTISWPARLSDGRFLVTIDPSAPSESSISVFVVSAEEGWLVDEIILSEIRSTTILLTPTTTLAEPEYDPGQFVRVITATAMRVGPSFYSEEITPIQIGTDLQILDPAIVDGIFVKVGIPGTENIGRVPALDVTSLQDFIEHS